MYVWHLIFRACAGSFYIFFSLFTMRQLCCWEIWALLKWTPKTNAFSMQIFILSPAFGQLVLLQRKIVKFAQVFFQTYQRREKCNMHWSLYRNSDIWYLENKRMTLLKKWNLCLFHLLVQKYFDHAHIFTLSNFFDHGQKWYCTLYIWPYSKNIEHVQKNLNATKIFFELKVSLFQNVLWVSSFRPKNQRIFFKNFGPSL